MSGINIYVGNLPFSANEDELRDLFEAYGAVESAKIILRLPDLASDPDRHGLERCLVDHIGLQSDRLHPI